MFFVHPEFKLPSKSTVVADEFDWSKSDAGHPFWGIRRQKADTDMWNVELHAEVATTVACNNLRGGSDFTNRPP